ncbi:MAG: vWA domain-containing protein [Bacillota bacterium]|nr:vWA domain-containing protein [Bacillota bacterium]
MVSVKRNSQKLLLTALIIFLIISCTITPVLLAEEILSDETLAIVMVIDVSGSMRYTDPQMLRETASRIFIDLLSPEDYLGVITFDHDANVVIPLQQVESASKKELFKETLSPRLQPRGNTDYLTALEAAFGQFKGTGTQGARPVVVFLTDGEPNPDPARQRMDPAFMVSYMESLWNIVDDFSLAGIPIYTVAFSGEIDPEIARKISLDTKGDSYILEEPGELLVSFFELLGNLKNRMFLLDNTFNLQAGSPEAFTFQVNDYTRQVNLIAVNLFTGKCELSIIPPSGESGEIEVIAVSNHESYSMVILSQLEKEYTGKWQAVVSGSGPVNVLGDMDLYIKGWLEEPVSSSQHPLNESIHFKVKVTGSEYLHDMPFKVEIQLAKPGFAPVFIPLTEDGSYYTGVYDDVDEVGIYKLGLRLFLEGQLVSTASSRLYVRTLPSLSADFWTDQGYRLGEEIVVTGSMTASGKKLQEGRELKVENFSLLLKYDDGARDVIPLYDQGSQEHGDIKAGDGVWSNRILFKREGPGKASLLAVGEYMASVFTLEKNLGPFDVFAPGKVSITIPNREHWSLPGKNLSLILEIQSESPFKETLIIEPQHHLGRFTQERIVLEPFQNTTINLGLNLFRNLDPGIYSIPLAFSLVNDFTELEPSLLELELEVLSLGKALLRYSSGVIAPLLYIAVIALITFIIFYAVGLLLFLLFVYPGKKIKGILLYNKTGIAGDELPKKIKLRKFRKDAIVISFNKDNKTADYYIEGSEFNYDIIFKNINGNHSPLFIKGWQALLKKKMPVKTVVYSTQPGIMEFEGKIFTRKELLHSDKFESGGFSFQYNSHIRGSQHKTNYAADLGADILEGKI